MNRPTIGRIVTYRTDGRNGLAYDLPAIITVTQDTHPGDYPSGAHNPLPVPDDDMHVHLTVFSPGGWGAAVFEDAAKVSEPHVPHDSADFVGAAHLRPGSGTYVEFNVPPNPEELVGTPQPRSWRWPVIYK